MPDSRDSVPRVERLREYRTGLYRCFTRSRDALSVTQRAGGEVTQRAGHRVTLYRKQPDGRWLLARDIHTLSPAHASPDTCTR